MTNLVDYLLEKAEKCKTRKDSQILFAFSYAFVLSKFSVSKEFFLITTIFWEILYFLVMRKNPVWTPVQRISVITAYLMGFYVGRSYYTTI